MSTGDRARWNRLASRYDRVIPWFSSRYDAVRERIRRDFAGVERVLEIGAGTGQFTFELAAVAGQIIATDIAPEMVTRLRDRVAASGVANVEIREVAADDIDAEDGAVDAVFCANVLHVMERPDRALTEFSRVLRSGGLLAAPTFCHGEHLLSRATSRLISLVSPFVAHTRYSTASLVDFVGAREFVVESTENLGGWLPLVYLRAKRAS